MFIYKLTKNMSLVLLKIGNYSIGENHPIFIIAEIGQNHQGDINIAKKLIEIAKKCGADCVKFQKTCIKEKFNKNALNRPYKSLNSFGESYGEHKSYLEFSNEEFIELQSFAKQVGILFTASPMDLVSLNFLVQLNVPFIKIGSGDANNFLLIREAAQTNIPLIISTGMQNFNIVKKIYQTVKEYHKSFALLHCVSAYPTPIADMNLNVIKLFKNEFHDINIGYSGHEIGIDLTVAAVALGAKIIERHITLDNKQKGSDHKSSLEPGEFKLLTKNIRRLEIALGKSKKIFQVSEMECFKKLGKTIVFAKSLEKGHRLTINDLKIKVSEPKGIDGNLLEEVLGKTLLQDVEEDDSLLECYLH